MHVIDLHTHVFPDWIQDTSSKIPVTWAPDLAPFQRARTKLRDWARPVSRALHGAQTWMRILPEPTRSALEWTGGVASAAHLMIESTADDLLEQMNAAEVNQAVVIANPPLVSNPFVLELARKHPDRIIAAAFAPSNPDQFDDLKNEGARFLKIHPALDGKGPDDPLYLALLEKVNRAGMPVILHTGCIHLPGFYKNPELGNVDAFRPWFEKFKKVPFVLAHMNFHNPDAALNLCEEFPQLLVDTSWQPSESISEAVRRIGSERVFLGSDWPLLGGNMTLSVNRVKETAQFGICNSTDIENILGQNARKLLGV